MYIYFDISFIILPNFKWVLMVFSNISKPAARKKNYISIEARELLLIHMLGTFCFTQASQNHQRSERTSVNQRRKRQV